MARRRPVPRGWREEHHRLDVYSRVVGRAPVSGNVYRARGRCSCGVEFNPAFNSDGSRSHSNILDRVGVIEAWKDHVEAVWLARCPSCQGDGVRVINPDWPGGTEPHVETCADCGGTGRTPG